MIKSFLTCFVLIFLFACTSPAKHEVKGVSKQDTVSKDTSQKMLDKTQVKRLGIYTLQGDSLVVPAFEIEVALSPKARERIVNRNETIIIDVFLEGVPKDSSKVHLEEDGLFMSALQKKKFLTDKLQDLIT